MACQQDSIAAESPVNAKSLCVGTPSSLDVIGYVLSASFLSVWQAHPSALELYTRSQKAGERATKARSVL